MESKGLKSCSQDPANWPYPGPATSNPHHRILPPDIPASGLLSSRFQTKIPRVCIIAPIVLLVPPTSSSLIFYLPNNPIMFDDYNELWRILAIALSMSPQKFKTAPSFLLKVHVILIYHSRSQASELVHSMCILQSCVGQSNGPGASIEPIALAPSESGWRMGSGLL
jgi:hypothetical protein